MNNKQNITPEMLEKLRQQLVNRIESTDDAALLSRCMALIDTAQMQTQEEQEEDLSEIDDDLVEVIDNPPSRRFQMRFPRQYAWIAALLLVAAGIFGLVRCLQNNKQERHQLVTVAKDYETIEVNGYHFNMVKVEGGTFLMGASKEMDDFDNDELPAHEVTLSDYFIGETEVTQGLWFAVMGERPMEPDGDDHPMKDVSFDESVEFIAKLNKLTGRNFHLPTEAQWEFAARGGNQTHHYPFSGSDNIDEIAWYAENCWDLGKEDPNFGNHPVGMKKPNELGIYDMAGNVWEWCHGSYERYDSLPQTNPTLNEKPQGAFRCNRGGSWDYIATSARVSNRRNRTHDFRNFNLGLRLAAEP